MKGLRISGGSRNSAFFLFLQTYEIDDFQVIQMPVKIFIILFDR